MDENTYLLDENQVNNDEVKTFASFWQRFIAHVIDNIIISIPLGIILFIIFITMVGNSVEIIAIFENPAMLEWDAQLSDAEALLILMFFFKFLIVGGLISIISTWLYFALLHSSAWQATIGKKLLNLKVTDIDGQRLKFGRATGRFFVKTFLSGILLIGYVLALLTEKNQSLHDLIAKTIVTKSS